MGVEFDQLVKYRDRIEHLASRDNPMIEACAKELAARFLRKVTKRTPVRTGNLRRNWGGSAGYDMQVNHTGSGYEVVITNNTEYASYVEYGHRTRNGGGWVKGQFFMTISEQEIQSQAGSIVQAKFERMLRQELDQ